MFHFESGQKEFHFLDGSRRIRFPDGQIKTLQANGASAAMASAHG
jgi:hypothetical protein